MKVRAILFSVLLVLVAAPSHAQLAGYINFTAQHVGAPASSPLGTAGNLNSGLWLYGPQFGIYKNFNKFGPVRVGADIRGSILSHGDAKLNNGLAGLRVELNTAPIPFRPWVQASAGIAGFNYGRRQALTNLLQYEVDGGIDMAILPRVDWRVFEIGGGGLSPVGTSGNPSNGLFHISSGLVVRLPF